MSTFAEQVQAAVVAHARWKGHLHQAIDTGSSDFRAEVVKQDNQCDFGKWLYGAGETSFPAAANYEEIRTLHAEFHREAAAVLALALAGRGKEAQAAMEVGSGFGKVSAHLVTTLTRARSLAA